LSSVPHFYAIGSQSVSRSSALSSGRPLPFRYIPRTHSFYRINEPQDHNAAGLVRAVKKFRDLIWDQSRDLPTCCMVLQSTNLLRATSLRTVKALQVVVVVTAGASVILIRV
jgi:hypothetical protein